MATEVLKPQDCLIERIRQPPVSMNHCYNSSKSIIPKPAKKAERLDKKREVVVRRRCSSDDMRIARRRSGIIREKVAILRRGESLDSKFLSLVKKEEEDDDLMSIYAGSAFAVSPSPSALPIPSFSRKSSPSSPSVAVDDFATRDLRRLLRLE